MKSGNIKTKEFNQPMVISSQDYNTNDHSEIISGNDKSVFLPSIGTF